MDDAKFHIAMEDMKQLTAARVRFFLSHVRARDNEWILEEMHEFGDEVNNRYYHMFKAGLIDKRFYQEVVSVARNGWTALKLFIREVEKECQTQRREESL